MTKISANSASAEAYSNPVPNNGSKLAAALDAARRGFRVFPLKPYNAPPANATEEERQEAIGEAKEPVDGFAEWQYRATWNEAQIRQWWAQYPAANIAGVADDLFINDVDPRKGGDLKIQELELVEDFPETLRSRTWSGGEHRFHRLPIGVRVKGGNDKLGRGIDIKTGNAYVLLPGSEIAGCVYAWADDLPIAEAPQWQVDKCAAAGERTAVSGKRVVEEDDWTIAACERWLAEKPIEASGGHRNNTAVIVANRFYDYAATQATCLDFLLQWNEKYCSPGLDTDEIKSVARSTEHNRDNAIGCSHPLAPGLDVHKIVDVLAPAEDGQADRPRIYAVHFDSAAGEALDRAGDPLIEDIIDRGTMSVWYGESNSGKTFVVLDASFHVAAGRPWATLPTHKGVVVYVAAEGGAGIWKRFRALKDRYADAKDVPLYLIPCPVNLLQADADLRPLATTIKGIEAEAGKVELVVIDTLSRAMPGGDENSPKDMTAFVHHLDILRRALKAHVAVVHHTGKDKLKGARGHSSLRAATDTEIEIGNRKMEVTKQRDMDGELRIGFALKPMRLGTSKTGREVTSCTVEMCGPGELAAEPIPLAPAQCDLLDEIESELIERCGGDVEAAGRCTFSTALAIDCAGRLPGTDARSRPPKSKAMRDHVNFMLREMRDKGHLKKPQRGQWILLHARDARDAKNQPSIECADARGAIAPRIAQDQSRKTPTGQNKTDATAGRRRAAGTRKAA